MNLIRELAGPRRLLDAQHVDQRDDRAPGNHRDEQIARLKSAHDDFTAEMTTRSGTATNDPSCAVYAAISDSSRAPDLGFMLADRKSVV